jgi:hypothetical protein
MNEMVKTFEEKKTQVSAEVQEIGTGDCQAEKFYQEMGHDCMSQAQMVDM